MSDSRTPKAGPDWSPGASKLAFGAGAVLLLAGASSYVLVGPSQFFQSYLIGFVLVLGIAIGSLGLQMLHALTGGQWGRNIRRSLHASSTTLPLVAALFLPLLLGMQHLYPWARPEAATDLVLQHKAVYLNVPFFVGRAVFYFVVWSALALLIYRNQMRRWSRPGGADKPAGPVVRTISGPGLLVCALTLTFAAFDWLMSLEPHWFSTIFGALLIVGSFLSAMCFSVLITLYDHRKRGTAPHIGATHDDGNLMLVFTMLWAYVSYSQYVIIYAANMAEDIPWYVHRSAGGWQHISFTVIVVHFALPFLVLLSRRTKRSPQVLIWVAGGMLGARLVEIFWMVAPNFYLHHVHVSWADVLVPLGVFGVWLGYFLYRYSDPDLARASVMPKEAALHH